MSSIDSSATDRVYHFISDPDHKENLSGRVRAACLTCRRKKIKCSGEANCKTCQEKGLVCEGLPERKRARNSVDLHDRSKFGQNSSSPTRGDLVPGSRRDSARSSSSDTERRRSSVQRRPYVTSAGSGESVDSGYISTTQSPVQRLVEGRQSSSSASRDASNRKGSPTDRKPNGTFDLSHHQDADSNESSVRADSQDAQLPPRSQLRWQEAYSGAEATPGTSGINSLLSTAELLEGQAQSLRRLASRQASIFSDENESHGSSAQPRHNPVAGYPMSNSHLLDNYSSQVLNFMESNTTNTMSHIEEGYDPWWNINQNVPTAMAFSYQQNHTQPQSHPDRAQQNGVWYSAAQALRYAIPTVSPPPANSRIQPIQWPLPSPSHSDIEQQYQWPSQV